MRTYIAAFLGAVLVMGALDAVWLTQMGPQLYRPVIGAIMADTVNMAAAMAFYLIYIAGIVILAVRPTLATGRWQAAAFKGAVLGFVAYATYDLTNQATLSHWSTLLTVIDICWGTFLTCVAATGGYFAARWVGSR